MAIERKGLTWLALLLACACSSNSNLPSGGATAPLSLHHAGGFASGHIKNVIVIIQENRTFENFFAGYPGANAPMSGCAIPPSGAPLEQRSDCPKGDVSVPLQRVTFEKNASLGHDWDNSITDWDAGKMDGFSKFRNLVGPIFGV